MQCNFLLGGQDYYHLSTVPIWQMSCRTAAKCIWVGTWHFLQPVTLNPHQWWQWPYICLRNSSKTPCLCLSDHLIKKINNVKSNLQMGPDPVRKGQVACPGVSKRIRSCSYHLSTKLEGFWIPGANLMWSAYVIEDALNTLCLPFSILRKYNWKEGRDLPQLNFSHTI